MNNIIAILLVGISLLTGCGNTDSAHDVVQKAEYKKISATEAKQMMESADDYILLDVRTEEEFIESRIEGAILIPDREIRNRVETEIPEEDTLIFVYCRSGGRSANAAKELVSMGYTNVYDFGGIMNWPYGTVSGR